MKHLLITLIVVAAGCVCAEAAGPALTTAAAVSTLAANGDAIVHSIHHPKQAGSALKKKVTSAVKFGKKNDGKRHDLPLPRAN